MKTHSSNRSFVLLLLVLVLIATSPTRAQQVAITHYWTGAVDTNWDNPNNWSPATVPGGVLPNSHAVALDNSKKSGSYTVTLSNTSQYFINGLTLSPNTGNTITLVIPAGNKLSPALSVGDDKDNDDITINSGGIILNSSGLTNGPSLKVTGTLGPEGILRINDGGRYIHNSWSDHTSPLPGGFGDGLFDQLSDAEGTELGVFEFKVPYPAPAPLPSNSVYNIDLGSPGDKQRSVGTLELTSHNGSAITYSSTGPTAPFTVRGNFIVNSSVAFKPTLASNYILYGNVIINGTFAPIPTGTSTVNISGTIPQQVSGLGTFSLGGGTGTSLEIYNVSGVTLGMNITLNVGSAQGTGKLSIISNTVLITNGSSQISGNGSTSFPSVTKLVTAHPDGVSGAIALTGTRSFDPGVSYEFKGTVAQNTGFLSSSVRNLTFSNPAGVTLNRSMNVSATLSISKDAFLITNSYILTGNGSSSVAWFNSNATLSTASSDVTSALPSFTARNFTTDNNFIFTKNSAQSTIGMPTTVNNLTIANQTGVLTTGSVTLSQNTTVNGILAMNSGSLIITGNALTINGNVTGAGASITAGAAGNGNNSDVIIGGTSNVGTLSFTSGSQTLRNFTLNRTGAGSVTLGSPLSVNGTLTLTKGFINTTSANLLTITENANTPSGSANSFVNGPVAKVSKAKTTYVLPTGKNAAYAPVSITTSSSAPTTFTAEYFNSNATAAGYSTNSLLSPLERVSLVEYWNVLRSGGGATLSKASVSLPWGPQSGVSNPSSITVGYWNGSQWIDANNASASSVNSLGASGTASNGNVTSIELDAFGPFTLGSYSYNPLPVTLITLSGKSENNSAILTWTTAREENNEGFYVEKSNDAQSFETIGFVKGNGNNESFNTYTFKDGEFTRSSYYRLKQVDTNGGVIYSKVIFIKNQVNNAPIQAFIYPNPTAGEISLRFEDNHQEISLTVQSSDGQVLFTGQGLPETVQADFSEKLQSMAPGLYLVRASQVDQYYQSRLVKR